MKKFMIVAFLFSCMSAWCYGADAPVGSVLPDDMPDDAKDLGSLILSSKGLDESFIGGAGSEGGYYVSLLGFLKKEDLSNGHLAWLRLLFKELGRDLTNPDLAPRAIARKFSLVWRDNARLKSTLSRIKVSDFGDGEFDDDESDDDEGDKKTDSSWYINEMLAEIDLV